MKELSKEEIRKYMEMAIEVMKRSIQEPRMDKVSPKVGAVLIRPNGEVDFAYRGELRHGDHAEFSLLERKNRAVPLDDALLFATLEPCAPGARKYPKLGCAERIVNARIKKVWIGIEDPDPSVDRKGIKYLQDNGIEVEMFPQELQKVIRDENKQFLQEALERAKKAEKPRKQVILSQKEKNVPISKLDDFSRTQVERFLSMAKLESSFGSELFNRQFHQLGYLALDQDNEYTPTGFGLLLFGERPQLSFPNALIRATLKTQGRNEEVQTFQGSLPSQIDQIQNWYETRIGSQIDRSKAERQVTYNYPLAVFREAIINAVVHRDYDIEGASIYFEINDEAIIVKSPGLPVSPITVEQIKQFNAPSLSRNPKIMYAFDQLKLVEQRGLGFMTMKGLLDQNLPLPIITVEEPYLIFTLPRYYSSLKELGSNLKLRELTEDQLKGYQWLTLVKETSAREYSSHFNIGYKTAQRHLAKMKEFDLIEDNGQAVNSPHFKYVIKQEYLDILEI